MLLVRMESNFYGAKHFLQNLLLITGLLLVTTQIANGQSDRRDEYVRALYLYNLTKFVTWPDEVFEHKEAPFVIGVVSNVAFAGQLKEVVKKKTVNRRPIVVKEIVGPVVPVECQILYISDDEVPLAALISSNGKRILTIGESEQFLKSGGAMSFFKLSNRIRLQINAKVAGEGLYRISSKVYKITTRYND